MAKKQFMSDVLRKAIEQDERSVNQIAKDSGVPQAVLSRFVRSERGINLTNAEKLAVALGLELRPMKRSR